MAKKASIDRPKRWDQPFGPKMKERDIDQALSLPLLSSIDAKAFPKSQKLRDIIKFDSRKVAYKKGDIVIRQGDYGNSVFLPISGSQRLIVKVPESIVKDEPALTTDTTDGHKQSFWQALKRRITQPKYAEVRDLQSYVGTSTSVRNVGSGAVPVARSFIKNVERIRAECETVKMSIEQNNMFGEIAALTRSVRTATIFADEDSELLEIRWQGLRDIRNRDKWFRAFIDDRYRERAMLRQLQSLPLFAHMPEDTLAEICQQTRYETFGDFEWNRTFKKADARDSESVIDNEPVIAQQGHYPNDLIVIASGFGRVSEMLDRKERTVDYLDRHDVFGLEEIVANWRGDDHVPYVRSLRAIGYVDILLIPSALIERHLLPNIPEDQLPNLVVDDENPWEQRSHEGRMDQNLIDFLINNRTINGTQTMMVNTDRCVNCDDCVRACAAAHDNNPRFVRHGPSEGNLMVANACMHCVDPVCLIGCPTGAIGRHQITGNVIINDLSCIGCGTCAASCPYDNIRMVEIRDQNGDFIVDRATYAPIVKATKCDLCQDQLTGPACQLACPHDALVRIDMRDHKSVVEWLNR